MIFSYTAVQICSRSRHPHYFISSLTAASQNIRFKILDIILEMWCLKLALQSPGLLLDCLPHKEANQLTVSTWPGMGKFAVSWCDIWSTVYITMSIVQQSTSPKEYDIFLTCLATILSVKYIIGTMYWQQPIYRDKMIGNNMLIHQIYSINFDIICINIQYIKT